MFHQNEKAQETVIFLIMKSSYRINNDYEYLFI